MRVRIVFKLKNKGAVLPFHHQGLIRSVLEMVVGSEYDLKNIPFNYSGLKGQTKVGRDGLHYFSKLVTLVFTSSDEQFVKKVVERFFKLGHFYLGNLQLEPELVEKETSTASEKKRCKYLCISPIIISSRQGTLQNKLFVSPDNPEFSKWLEESTRSRMESHGYSFGDGSADFVLEPDSDYISRLTSRGKKFARIYTLNFYGESLEVRGYTFPFLLESSPEVHDFIFENGFGELTQHGFGMLDLTNSKAFPRKVILRRQQRTSLGNR